jgi:hypothetical protein
MTQLDEIKSIIDSINPDFLNQKMDFDFYYDNPSAACEDVEFYKGKLLSIIKILEKNEG